MELLQQLEKSLKDEEVVSKEIMAMTEAEIENEIKEVRLTDFESYDFWLTVETLFW